MPNSNIKPEGLVRFNFHTGGYGSSGYLKKASDGDLILLADVQPVLRASLEIELYGATSARLDDLGRKLREVGL